MKAVAGLLLVLAASPAFAGDGIADEVKAALARNDRAAALVKLEEAAAPGVAHDRRRSVEAARAAMDLVGGREGDLLAARILVGTLQQDKSDRESAYVVAMGLRKRVQDVDLPAARELFRGLVRIYPESLEFDYDLAKACLHSGLPDEAIAEYERIRTLAPSARDARYQLALLHKDRGELDAAVADYDELIRLSAEGPRPDLRAHLYKGWLLLGEKRDCAAARAALEAGLAAAAGSTERDTFLPQFADLRSEIEIEEQRRRELHAMQGHLVAALWGVAAAWTLVLGGGLAHLRRRSWI